MFIVSEAVANVMAKERTQVAGCADQLREWCSLECRVVSRHG